MEISRRYICEDQTEDSGVVRIVAGAMQSTHITTISLRVTSVSPCLCGEKTTSVFQQRLNPVRAIDDVLQLGEQLFALLRS
jgi:hypothetical protein